MLAHRLGQVAEPTGVEMVRGLVEQEQIGPGGDHPRQAHPVALAHGHRVETAPPLGDRADLLESDLEAAGRIPGVDRRGRGEGVVVALRRGGPGVLAERRGGLVESVQHAERTGQELVEQCADGARIRCVHGQLLRHDAEAAVSCDRSGIGFEVAAERLEEGALAASVLPDHGEAVARSEGEVHAAQQHPAAAGEVEVPGAQVRSAGGGADRDV